MKIQISDNLIKHYLENVYLINGHSYAGKSNTFGTLETGLYRFCKGVTDHRAAGDNDHAMFCADFEIS